MKYEVYCSLNINECIEVDAEDDEDALFEAKEIFADNINDGHRCWKESEYEIVFKEE